MYSISGALASRGTLLALRRRLRTVRRAKEILEMRRDQLVKEVFALIDRLKRREEVEKEFVSALIEAYRLMLTKGELDFFSSAKLVKPPKLSCLPVSLQGIVVPKVRVIEEPGFEELRDPDYRRLAERLWNVLKELVELASTEEAVVKLCDYLSYINRIVNSLERNVIPRLENTVRYVEEKLSEETLEEFVRLKRISERVREEA